MKDTDIKIEQFSIYLLLFIIKARGRKDGILYSNLKRHISNYQHVIPESNVYQLLVDFSNEGLIVSVGYDLTFDIQNENAEHIIAMTKKGNELVNHNNENFANELRDLFESTNK